MLRTTPTVGYPTFCTERMFGRSLSSVVRRKMKREGLHSAQDCSLFFLFVIWCIYSSEWND